MKNDTLAMLDQAELFQLAISVSGAGDSASAIAYLKEAVSRADATAAAHYLLGAEYAQIRLYDRAMDEMEAAIALDPALWTARLQLALLYLGANKEERAADALRPLAEMGDDAALQQFATGLLALIGNDMQRAIQALADGIERNESNPALNGDMQRIIDEIGRRLEEAPQPAEDSEGADHILLSAYAGNQRH
ncbi:tetratricopeptide repeat protein [[Empedobacter] haloabium]|uniref:Tetratricopeptide repeat protein n=1 Tax=[Empedobacter] haloabium TaxID=592317 RepID=A0ABZ1UIF4_9BURK